MPIKRKGINIEAILKISKVLVALTIIFAPIVTFWDKFKLPDIVDLELVVKLLISIVYIIILYLVYYQLSRGFEYGEE